MRINFSTLLPFLFYVFKGTSAQTPRDVVTYTTKTVEKLECSFTSTVIVQWIEQKDDGNINLFLYDVRDGLVQKQTNDSKYDNFHYSIEGTNGFNLVINNVDKGDGGHYLCIRITSPAVSFDVNVEVLPESINIHCTEISACLPSAEKEADPQINCLCAATGLRSSGLEIEWDGVDTFTASDTTRVKNPTSGSFIIRSNITLPSPNGTASVSCSLTGYRSQIPKRLRSYTYTFSPPVCNLVHYCPSDGTNASLICSCSRGSPKVNAYSFYDSQKSPIGTQRSSSKSVQVEANKIEMFFCSGCNGVSDNQIVGLEFNCKQGPAWWIFIVILPVVVVAAIICFVVKKHWCSKGKGVGPKRKQDGKRDEEHPLNDNTEAQEHQKLHDPRSEDTEGIKPDVSISGDPATKDKDKGIKPDVSTSGDPATKDKDKEEEKKPLLNDQAPKNDKDDKGKKEPDNDVPQRDTPKKKGAKKDPSKNLEPKAEAPKAEAPKTEVSKKEGEDRLEAGGSEVDPEGYRTNKQLEACGSEVDPEGYRTNKQSNQNNPKRGAENEVKSSQKNGSNEQAAPSSTERSQGDGQDNDAQGIEEATNRNDDGSKSNSKEQAYTDALFQSGYAGVN